MLFVKFGDMLSVRTKRSVFHTLGLSHLWYHNSHRFPTVSMSMFSNPGCFLHLNLCFPLPKDDLVINLGENQFEVLYKRIDEGEEKKRIQDALDKSEIESESILREMVHGYTRPVASAFLMVDDVSALN